MNKIRPFWFGLFWRSPCVLRAASLKITSKCNIYSFNMKRWKTKKKQKQKQKQTNTLGANVPMIKCLIQVWFCELWREIVHYLEFNFFPAMTGQFGFFYIPNLSLWWIFIFFTSIKQNLQQYYSCFFLNWNNPTPIEMQILAILLPPKKCNNWYSDNNAS